MRISLACAFACCVCTAGAAHAQDGPRYENRMGAFQCLVCTDSGGALIGVRSESHDRVIRKFGPYKELCVAAYTYIAGELYVSFKLDDRPWPDRGDLSLKASSWNAVCAANR